MSCQAVSAGRSFSFCVQKLSLWTAGICCCTKTPQLAIKTTAKTVITEAAATICKRQRLLWLLPLTLLRASSAREKQEAKEKVDWVNFVIAVLPLRAYSLHLLVTVTAFASLWKKICNALSCFFRSFCRYRCSGYMNVLSLLSLMRFTAGIA